MTKKQDMMLALYVVGGFFVYYLAKKHAAESIAASASNVKASLGATGFRDATSARHNLGDF